eukprot:COSAG02_NODE_1287_length_13452_cov_16.608403_5_plen_97_part_00
MELEGVGRGLGARAGGSVGVVERVIAAVSLFPGHSDITVQLCLSVCLSVCPSVCLSVCLSVCVPDASCVWLYTCGAMSEWRESVSGDCLTTCGLTP